MSGEPKAPKDRATRSGIPIEPLYGPQRDSESVPPPGIFPFTRGIHANMYRGKLWTMRQYAGFGTPAETNERFRYLLAQGQTGLSLALDLPTQLGLDPDAPEAEGEVGKVGVSIASVDDMERVFEAIDLGRVSTSMTINATAPILAAMYEEVAVRRGVPRERIAGTVQNDPLKEFGARGAWLYPIEPSMRLAVDLIQDCCERLPRFNPISIASHYRDAGATPSEEAGYTLSAAVAYVERCLARGMALDRFAPRLSFFWYTYTNFFEEVAKYRAARRLWATLMRDRFGATSPESMKLRAACVCGGHSLTRSEPLNNIARTTLECFAVACAGLQSVFTAAFDEAYAIPTELSARTALRVQQIVAFETEVAATSDPLGGSYFVEALTDAMEAKILQVMEQIGAQGGMVRALESGYVQREIARRAYEYQRALESGEVRVVGVGTGDHRDNAQLVSESTPAALTQAERALAHAQIDERVRQLRALRAERSNAAAARALDALERAAAGEQNLMPALREAVRVRATVGEIAAALGRCFGHYSPPGWR